MNENITNRVAELRARQERLRIIDEMIDEMVLAGLIKWNGTYRNGKPVYVRTDLEPGDA